MSLVVRKRPNYRRRAGWFIFISLLIAYILIVGGWWIEGNNNLQGGSDNADVKTSN